MKTMKLMIGILFCTFALTSPIFAQKLKVPAGCTAVSDAKAGVGGYADRVIHGKTGIELVLIAPGSFTMGINELTAMTGQAGPAHKVSIAKPFYMGKTTLTNGQYRKFLASGYDGAGDCDPAYDLHVRHLRGKSIMPSGDEYPVVWVSWKNARAFCEWAGGLDLPTEAEWEYACRAGTTTLYSFGDDPKEIGLYAWTMFDAKSTTQPVGQLIKPNPWGLYDMYGNVWQWCLDDFKTRYEGAPVDGAAWMIAGAVTKSLRGGSWCNTLMYANNSVVRFSAAPVIAANDIGFRVVLRTD